MYRRMLRDDQWARIEALLPCKKSDPGRTDNDNRRVLWIMRTGSPWCDLPEALGHWRRTYVRFSRWREKGVWVRMASALQGDADMERLFIDSTLVRAHQHCAGAKKSRSTGNWPLVRRTEYKAACRRGRPGQSAAHHSDGRPDCGYRADYSADQRTACRVRRR